jgi:hypothetical protein
VLLAFVVAHGGAGASAKWLLCSEDVGKEVVSMSLFPNFVGGI